MASESRSSLGTARLNRPGISPIRLSGASCSRAIGTGCGFAGGMIGPVEFSADAEGRVPDERFQSRRSGVASASSQWPTTPAATS